jgi:chromate reductase
MSNREENGLVVCGIAGSLRADSYNRALLRAAVELAPPGLQLRVFDRVGNLPLFDQDVEADGDPEPVAALKRAILESAALLIASPEYSRSVTGVLKNALDWAARPPRNPTLSGKPVAIMGASPGRFGTVNSQRTLREILRACGCQVMPRPELYVGGAADVFDEKGRLADEATQKRLQRLLDALAEWSSA